MPGLLNQGISLQEEVSLSDALIALQSFASRQAPAESRACGYSRAALQARNTETSLSHEQHCRQDKARALLEDPAAHLSFNAREPEPQTCLFALLLGVVRKRHGHKVRSVQRRATSPSFGCSRRLSHVARRRAYVLLNTSLHLCQE